MALHAQARASLEGFRRWSIRSVPRAENAAADALVNRALDGEQVPPAAIARERADDELVLGRVHRADELWFELMLHELTAARDELAAGRPHAAAPRLRRVVAVWRLLVGQLEVLETLGPEGAPASGCPVTRARARSPGSRASATAWAGGGDPPAGGSLYEAFAGGLGLPEDRDARLETLAGLDRDDAGDAAARRLARRGGAAARPRRMGRPLAPPSRPDDRAHGAGPRRLGGRVSGHPLDRRFFPELWDVRLRAVSGSLGVT